MSCRTYRPRRASQQWRQDAPEFVLDVFDDPRFADRYTVLFGGSLLSDTLLKERKVFCLGMSDNPSHPQGVSMWGEVDASWRPSHRRVRWNDLPEHVRKHVVARATT